MTKRSTILLSKINKITYVNIKHARMEVMTYGWWNSANHLLPHVNTHYRYEEEFEKLLIDIECDCDEP